MCTGVSPTCIPYEAGTIATLSAGPGVCVALVAFAPKAVMFGYNHVPAWEECLPMMENYAWVIESVYEQTIQGMNEGRTADELATSVRLPEALRNLLCLGDIYGVIPGAAREIFAAKIGWFNGNPTPLVRLTPAEQSARMAILLVEQTFLSAGQGRPRRRETIAGLPFLQSS